MEELKNELDQINNYLENNKIAEALKLFKKHVKKLDKVGPFSVETWDKEWRKKVYTFGEYFKNIKSSQFINIINDIEDSSSKECRSFYESEIYLNSSLLESKSKKKKLEELIETFPENLEFHHNLGHVYSENNTEFSQAIDIYKKVFLKEKDNEFFLDDLFNHCADYIDFMLDDSEYKKCHDVIEEWLDEKLSEDFPLFNNHLMNSRRKCKEYLQQDKKIQKAMEDVSKQAKKEQFKIIEILGFFTAIIAFIFSTVSIGKNFKFNEAIIFNVSLAITLIIFVLTMNLFFSVSEKQFWKDRRVYGVVFLVICLMLLACNADWIIS